MSQNTYTVKTLLEEAERTRRPKHVKSSTPGYEWDHIIELQLVVAALNRLNSNSYSADGWQQNLVDYFNSEDNLQSIPKANNRAKGQAVSRWIDRNPKQGDKIYIQRIRDKWATMRSDFEASNFKRFANQMDSVLAGD